jgi:chromate transporter
LHFPFGGTPFGYLELSDLLTSEASLEDLSQPLDPAVPMTPPGATRDAVSLWHLFLCFIKIGVTSFGGSTQAWIFRAVVEERRWLSETDFLAGVTIAQILPGANPVNLSLYVGQRLRGGIGALVATLGMVGPAICIVLAVGAVYARLANYPLTHFLLIGIATVGVGATLAAGLKVARKIERRPAIIAIGLATFVAVGVLHWSMVPVVAVLAPLSVAIAARRPHG